MENSSLRTYTIADAMVGASLLGGALSDKPEHMPLILLRTRNEVQEMIMVFSFHKQTGSLPSSEDDVSVGWEFFEAIQDSLRRRIELAVMVSDFNEQLSSYPKQHRTDPKQQARINALVNQHKDAQKPHQHGTIAEITTKLNISKSEVRRLKQEGTLDAALDKHYSHSQPS